MIVYICSPTAKPTYPPPSPLENKIFMVTQSLCNINNFFKFPQENTILKKPDRPKPQFLYVMTSAIIWVEIKNVAHYNPKQDILGIHAYANLN